MMAKKTDMWLWLTLPVAIFMGIASGSGVFVDGLYRDTPNLVAQAKGQDAFTLFVALPTVMISALLAWRGSPRARLIWLGGLVYTVYTYVGYAFAVRFNSLFLVYVALLGCSTYALIGGLVTTDWVEIKAMFMERTPVKAISLFFGVITALFYLLWLSEAVPASLTGMPPQSLVAAGTPTNFVQVLDMAWLLPATAMAAVNLWRKRSSGYVLAGVLLTHFVLLTSAILSMIVFMVREGQPVVLPQVVIYSMLFAVSIGMEILYLKNLRSSLVTVD